MAHHQSPLDDLEQIHACCTSWGVRVRRFFVFLSLLPCVLLLAYAVADHEPRDLNNLWNVEPVKTLDRLCMPRTFFLSPRVQCNQSLKQICICYYSFSMFVSEDPPHDPEQPSNGAVDATLDHLW
jgi:hypothetical protein